jgi:hypothetical protein
MLLSLAFATLSNPGCGDAIAPVLDATGSPDELTPDASSDAASDRPDTSIEDADELPAIPLPALVETRPLANATNVPATAWMTLTFASSPPNDALRGFALDCGTDIAITAESLDTRVFINPAAALPATDCALTWPGPDGPAALRFTVVAPAEDLIVPYDRADPTRFGPFPDDALLVEDPNTPTGRRVELPTVDRPEGVVLLLDSLEAVLPENLDGFSALAPIVFEVPASLNTSSLPITAAETLEPDSTLALFDITEGHPTYLSRLPFDLVLKEEPNADATEAHILLVFPLEPLRPKGRYALAVTRRAFADPSRILAPSPAMAAAMGDPSTPSGSATALLANARPALLPDDLALVLSVSVRSFDTVGDDLMAIRRAILAEPPPEFVIDSVTRPNTIGSPIAATVKGRWYPLGWRDGNMLARDAEGRPKFEGVTEIPFVLSLPKTGAAPIIMYQHGNPGSAEREVPSTAGDGFAREGFAIAGFTDIINREIGNTGDVSNYGVAVLQDILTFNRVPDFIAVLDTAYQLSFIRLLTESFATLDVLPVDAPDGVPDLDTSKPLGYLGISFGSFRGVGLVPFAPEIHAAALVVGGGRFCSTIAQQESEGRNPIRLYEMVTSLFPEITRYEFWVGVALAQAAVENQDWLTHARRLYGDEKYPLERPERASVLLIEGLGDSLVPTYSTRAAALSMGLWQFDDVPDPVPGLEMTEVEIQSNIDEKTSGGFLQYVASDVPGFAVTEGCENRPDGHYCAQVVGVPPMLRFFSSALSGVPVIAQ